MRLIPLAVISLFIPFEAGEAQAPFEGVVSTTITVAGAPPMESVMHVKGTRGRAEMSIAGMQAYSIMDFDKGTIVAVMPAQKMYMKQDMNEALSRVKNDSSAASEVRIEPLRRKGSFAGVACDYYLITFEGKEVESCIAQGIGTFFGMSAGGGRGGPGSAMPRAMREFARKFKKGGFMLKTELREAGQTRMTMEVTKLEKKPVADSMFVMPEGYQDMSGMMKNLPGRTPPGSN